MTDSVRQPDLSVYYDILKTDTEASETRLTKSLVQIGSLYTSSDLTHKIGNIVFDRVKYTESEVDIVWIADAIIKLPFGTLCAQRTFIKSLGPNETAVYTILSGSEDFLGSKGYVTFTSTIRRADFWFDKQ